MVIGDQQYCILTLTDFRGAVLERVACQALGQPTFTNAAGTTLSSSAKAIRYSYTGRKWDPSLELHHFGARWMSGVSGRFFGTNPIGFSAGSNFLLQICHSKPSRLVDPTGKQISPPIAGSGYPYPLVYTQQSNGNPNQATKSEDPYHNPTRVPFTDRYRLTLRCWNIATRRHCGILVDKGDGNYISIDGRGGDRNPIDWIDPAPFGPEHNNPIYGPPYLTGYVEWNMYPSTVCEYLRKTNLLYNTPTIQIPRHSTRGCNRNTMLRCLSNRCAVRMTELAKGGLWFDCGKEYYCTQWARNRPSKPPKCPIKYCKKWEDFCDFWARHAQLGLQTEIPEGQYGS